MQLVFSVIIWVLFGFGTAYVAQQRGRDPTVWFAVGFFLGFIGLLLVYFLPSAAVEREEPVATPAPADQIPDENTLLPSGFKESSWFYLTKEREQVGPIKFGDLEDHWHEGAINSATFAWCKGMHEWKRLEELDLPYYWKTQ